MSEANENESIEYKNYVVIWLDVLGQSQKLRDFPDIPNQELFSEEDYKEKRKEFISYIKNTVGKVELLRHQFEELYTRTRIDDSVKIGVAETVMYSISDSTIIAIPLSQNGRCEAIHSIFHALVAISGIILISLSGGIVLRGGIDVGSAYIIKKNEIYGQALARAVYLEEKIAEYPRVVVGKSFREYLEHYELCKPRNPYEKASKDFAKICRQMLFIDTDGVFAVDYLSETMNDVIRGSVNEETVKEAFGYVKSQYERFLDAGDDKHTQRYYRMLLYFGNRIEGWNLKFE